MLFVLADVSWCENVAEHSDGQASLLPRVRRPYCMPDRCTVSIPEHECAAWCHKLQGHPKQILLYGGYIQIQNNVWGNRMIPVRIAESPWMQNILCVHFCINHEDCRSLDESQNSTVKNVPPEFIYILIIFVSSSFCKNSSWATIDLAMWSSTCAGQTPQSHIIDRRQTFSNASQPEQRLTVSIRQIMRSFKSLE